MKLRWWLKGDDNEEGNAGSMYYTWPYSLF